MVNLVIMAAGLGSRYGGYKQIEGVGPNNELLLEYAIYDAIALGFHEVILVINEKIAQWIRTHLSKAGESIPISYVIQQSHPYLDKPPGTAHAVMIAMEQSGNPAVIINADDFYGKEPLAQLFKHLSSKSTSAMIAYHIENTLSDVGHVSRGVLEMDANRLLIGASEHKEVIQNNHEVWGVEETSGIKRKLNGALVSMNLWGLQPSVSAFFRQEYQKHDFSDGEFYLPNSISKGINQGTLSVEIYETKHDWFGMTYSSDLEKVKSRISHLIKSGHYPDFLWRS